MSRELLNFVQRLGQEIQVVETEEGEDRDRGRDDSRGRDANPPFSIFPQAETNESSSSLRLTPNTQSQSRGHDQDLTTWRHIVDVEPPPIARRYPPAPVLHH